ncbi:MAG: OmpA family protein [Kofleriaceae bacterium]
MHLLDGRIGRYIAFAFVLAIVSAIAVVTTEPPRGRVVVTDTETEILENIEFAPGTAMLLPKSLAILDAVATTLHGNPSITLVEVQLHTSRMGDEIANLSLAERRAAVVTAYLENVGIEPARLSAQGYGDTQPIDRTPGSWKNERISFLILTRLAD